MPRLSPSFLRSQISLLTLLAFLLFFGFSACVRRARNLRAANEYVYDQQSTMSQSPKQIRININTAPASELETLPGIGKGLAERIIEQREKFGPFRRPEHLIIVRGISDKRFRALRDLVTVD